MKKEDAFRSILTEWRRLPEIERQTESQLVAFAMRMANDPNYAFQSRSDRYQDIMGYMTRHTSGLKKMGI